MREARLNVHHSNPAVEVFLLGQIDFESCWALQQRLVYETCGRSDGQISLLLAEHPPLVTIGRMGSRDHLHLPSTELVSRRVDVRWVNRGGGALVHGPGQLAVYPIVPLEWHKFSVGDYLGRLRGGLLAAMADFRINGQVSPAHYDILGRTGRLAAVGAAVKSWTTYFGAYVNVAPTAGLLRFVGSTARGQSGMSSMVAESQRPIRMASVRASVIRHLIDALGCSRHHIYSGHPLLAAPERSYERTAV